MKKAAVAALVFSAAMSFSACNNWNYDVYGSPPLPEIENTDSDVVSQSETEDSNTDPVSETDTENENTEEIDSEDTDTEETVSESTDTEEAEE